LEKLQAKQEITNEILQKATDKFSSFFEDQFCSIMEENQKLRNMLKISQNEKEHLKEFEQKIRELELQSDDTKAEQALDDTQAESIDNIHSVLTKAIHDAKKRKHKQVNESKSKQPSSSIDSEKHVLNKEAAHKNMKPKTAYLLGSPDNSDEEEEEEEEATISTSHQGKYLL